MISLIVAMDTMTYDNVCYGMYNPGYAYPTETCSLYGNSIDSLCPNTVEIRYRNLYSFDKYNVDNTVNVHFANLYLYTHFIYMYDAYICMNIYLPVYLVQNGSLVEYVNILNNLYYHNDCNNLYYAQYNTQRVDTAGLGHMHCNTPVTENCSANCITGQAGAGSENSTTSRSRNSVSADKGNNNAIPSSLFKNRLSEQKNNETSTLNSENVNCTKTTSEESNSTKILNILSLNVCGIKSRIH